MQTAIEVNMPAPNAGGDAELLSLATELDAAFQKEWEAHERARLAEERGESFAEHEAEAERIVADSKKIADRISALPASTPAGMFAKARAVVWCLGGDDELTFAIRDEGAAPDERLARSLVQDVLRIHAGAVPTNDTQREQE